MGNKIEAEASSEIKTILSSHGQSESKMLNNGANVNLPPTTSSTTPVTSSLHGAVPFGATIVKYEPSLDTKLEATPNLNLSMNSSDISPRKVGSRL